MCGNTEWKNTRIYYVDPELKISSDNFFDTRVAAHAKTRNRVLHNIFVCVCVCVYDLQEMS